MVSAFELSGINVQVKEFFVVEVIPCGIEHVEQLVPLFDQYRVFYGQTSDEGAARAFIKGRLSHGDSQIFMAVHPTQKACGFLQLYPIFSSVNMSRAFLLNDLFVHTSARGQGIADQLMAKAESYAKAQDAGSLILETAVDNHPARNLYQKQGWRENAAVTYYHKSLK